MLSRIQGHVICCAGSVSQESDPLESLERAAATPGLASVLIHILHSYLEASTLRCFPESLLPCSRARRDWYSSSWDSSAARRRFLLLFDRTMSGLFSSRYQRVDPPFSYLIASTLRCSPESLLPCSRASSDWYSSACDSSAARRRFLLLAEDCQGGGEQQAGFHQPLWVANELVGTYLTVFWVAYK
jgi:hypothetical protein